jgi:hypothetical protein
MMVIVFFGVLIGGTMCDLGSLFDVLAAIDRALKAHGAILAVACRDA